MINKKDIISVIACCLLLTGCIQNNEDTKTKKTIINVSSIKQFKYEYSIGLTEIKPIRFYNVLGSLDMRPKDYANLFDKSFSSILLYSSDHKTEIKEVAPVINPYINTTNKLTSFTSDLFFIKSNARFDALTISYIDFIFDNEILSVECDINLTFNEKYTDYPVFPDSYTYHTEHWMMDDCYPNPWERKIFSGRWGFIDLRKFYTLDDQVILKSISFSNKTGLNIDNVLWSTYHCEPNEEKLNWYNEDCKKLEFTNFEGNIDLIELMSKNDVFVFDITYKGSGSEVYAGNVHFELTINGNDYLIKDTFFRI